MKLICRIIFLGFVLIGAASCADSDQQPDPDFTPKNTKNSFVGLKSPTVFIDDAHYNVHTAKDRLKPFVKVLQSDGYTVKTSSEKFTLEHLKQADILVIANALDSDRKDYNPPYGDAFTTDEVQAVKQWVSEGGALFFIADHTPYPKMAEKLSNAFGFEFSNGHVNRITFRIDTNTLKEHAITNGVLSSERIVQVKSLGGAAFQIPPNAKSLLTLGKGKYSDEPIIPFQVNGQTPRISVQGWSQGAVLEVGEGRIAVFAETAMFTSQLILSTGDKLGFTTVGAEQNEQFLLNVMHWLSKILN
jgi:hypothetical protein